MALQVETLIADSSSQGPGAGRVVPCAEGGDASADGVLDSAIADGVARPAVAENESLPTTGLQLDDLAQIIESYNNVTEKLQHSHDVLSEEVVRLQKELAGKDAQLQRSKRLAALGEMAAGIAHEIRNPLAAIQLYAQMLAGDLSEFESRNTDFDFSEQVNTSSKIASAVRGLNGVVNDVLSFSRELKPQLKSVKVSDLFDRAVESHWPAIEAAGVEVIRSGGANTDSTLAVSVDVGLVHQAVLNLIRNAVDAMGVGEGSVNTSTDPGASSSEITDSAGRLLLDAWYKDQQVVLLIRDTGSGIPEEAIDRIFNPFFTTRNTGTGLGLAIVHRIVDAHGGAIVVSNDGGAVFELRLPCSNSTV